ncbi:Na+/H+ antiporter subunit C [Loktanella sp. TSTF-M6]|uniref:Na+/H+ antiporter subunit C n=1 Tax=Loktanella gaetbuli TaxID=2881335 RepID=A0ABS8BYJ2_9RHOB|nr:Na+/H+ antiporter subunit C [Loktanella gaetbuli]MCB5200764.1 Na+/H+ antiporter subunit C [Loktanella gaetbuli]
MELLVATAVGMLTASGIYMVLRLRTFPVIIGISLLTYAVNVFLFGSGRLLPNAPAVLTDGVDIYSDPLPQALVLTAIVISFGMTAVVVIVALGSWLANDDDMVDTPNVDTEPDAADDQARGGAQS